MRLLPQIIWVRIITNNYRLPIDDVKEFLYQTVGDDSSSEVDFSDYTHYWKSDNQGEITAMISTVIPFDILRQRIAEQWTIADKIGNSFVEDMLVKVDIDGSKVQGTR